MDRATKEAELQSLVEHFSKASVAVCADYRGLTVSKITDLRRELKKAGSTGKVVRNTLARLAVQKVEDAAKRAEVEKFLDIITGPTLVVFSYTDPIAPTKVLTAFAKGNDKFRVKGCWLDGAYVDPEGVTALSKMPGREETFAMLLNLISTPATQLVRLLNEPGAQMARTIEAHRKKLGGEGEAAAA